MPVTAVDPFPADWRYGDHDTESRFRANTARAGVAERIDLRVASSAETRAGWSGPADLVYIDGKHDYWTVRDDLRWAGVRPGRRHACSSTTRSRRSASPSPCSATCCPRGGCGTSAAPARWRGWRWPRPAPPTGARMLAELPWWLRNLVVKVLLRLRLRPLARVLGHDDTADPY